MKCQPGFHVKQGDITTCWNDNKLYTRNGPTSVNYGNCDESNLSNVIYGVNTCSGWKGDINCSWNDCASRSKCNAGVVSSWSDCATKSSCNGHVCNTWDWCEDKCCNAGTVSSWSDCASGNDCIGATVCKGGAVTRDRSKSCPSGQQLENNDSGCYDVPKDGYKCTLNTCTPNGGISQTCNDFKNNIPSCNSNRQLEDNNTLCYIPPKSGYNCTVTNCSPTNAVSMPCTDKKNSTPSCNTNRQLEDNNTSCYIPPKSGYNCTATNCSPTNAVSMLCTDKKNSTPSCNSNRQLEDNNTSCYIPPISGYKCTLTGCQLDNYVPKSYPKPSYDRGVGVNVNEQKINFISYSDNPCSPCDLTFYNTLYIKPNNITLPNDIPITNNLYAYYDSSSFLNNIWYDLTNNNNHVVNVNGDIKINNNYIYGDNNSSILFPCEILPPVYTIFHICKYNGKNNGSILYGYDNVDSPSWYSGFYKNKSGIASHGGSITQDNLSIFNNKWVFSTDSNNTYRANAYNYTTNNNYNSYAQLAINNNLNPSDNSDWACACIIVFNRNLSISEINLIDFWLVNKFSDLWKLTFSKPFNKIGYSCNPANNKIGKITNNYSEYQYATYDEQTPIDCEWLQYPPQNSLNNKVCYVPQNIVNSTITPTTKTSIPTNGINTPAITSNSSDLCSQAFSYYDLYASKIPIVIKGIDPNYSIENNVTDDTLLYKIGKNNTGAFSQVLEGFENNPNYYYKYN